MGLMCVGPSFGICPPAGYRASLNRVAAKNEAWLSCHDLRDSGAIGNDAEAVILIDRTTEPDNARRASEPVRTLEILIGKNRYGTTFKMRGTHGSRVQDRNANARRANALIS